MSLRRSMFAKQVPAEWDFSGPAVVSKTETV